MRYYPHTPVRMATIKKQKIKSVGKDMEKPEPLCIVGGIAKWCKCYGKHMMEYMKAPQTIKNRTTI